MFAVSSAGQEDPIAARRFFQIEYAMDTAIAEFPKPYISLIDGSRAAVLVFQSTDGTGSWATTGGGSHA